MRKRSNKHIVVHTKKHYPQYKTFGITTKITRTVGKEIIFPRYPRQWGHLAWCWESDITRFKSEQMNVDATRTRLFANYFPVSISEIIRSR